MKKTLQLITALFIFIATNHSFSQEFNSQINTVGLEEINLKDWLSQGNYISKLQTKAKEFELKIQTDAEALRTKVEKYDKEARKMNDATNQARLVEVQGMEKSIREYQEKAQKILQEMEFSFIVQSYEDFISQTGNSLIIDGEKLYSMPSETPLIINKGKDIQNQPESTIKHYFNNISTDSKGVEGIWEFQSPNISVEKSYKLAIIKSNSSYKAYSLNPDSYGDFKANISTTASNLLTINWTTDNLSKVQSVGLLDESFIKFQFAGEESYIFKLFQSTNNTKSILNNESPWKGNGSGIFISKFGYIVTNHHVIEGANELEVEFILNEEVQNFKAEVVQVDKTNDLAILKIEDPNFNEVENLPYNFKTRSSDVGTKVYAYGYPMALSVMGKEIKITDGIISSKSGYDGDITTYQISAPIQGGNSGGPLFDEKGNFIGINSSGLGADVANNVGYTIKSSYVLNLIDVLPKTIDLPSSTKLQSLPLTEQIKEISKYVVLIKVK
ncbi:trypsin-like peptidase domain-containing protein [Bacteroidota bacterium]|nr:trypsin-like peptidase domain-containing protein [Bacteroidota bacterium]